MPPARDFGGARSFRFKCLVVASFRGVPFRVQTGAGRPDRGAAVNRRDDAPRQFVLALDHRQSFDRAEFLPGSGNIAALTWIDRWPDWPSNTLALAGPEGAGKSHLAAIWAHAANALTITGNSIEEAAVPDALATGALVIEDLGSTSLAEAALFHLLNLAKEQRAWVLVTARRPPTHWPIVLADLASRLRAMPVVTLTAPDDAMLRGVLVKQFADRQLAVDDGLIGFLAERIERSYAAARNVVAELDHAALALKRPVNRALAGEILGRRSF